VDNNSLVGNASRQLWIAFSSRSPKEKGAYRPPPLREACNGLGREATSAAPKREPAPNVVPSKRVSQFPGDYVKDQVVCSIVGLWLVVSLDDVSLASHRTFPPGGKQQPPRGNVAYWRFIRHRAANSACRLLLEMLTGCRRGRNPPAIRQQPATRETAVFTGLASNPPTTRIVYACLYLTVDPVVAGSIPVALA
jgi:hypothetical protein